MTDLTTTNGDNAEFPALSSRLAYWTEAGRAPGFFHLEASLIEDAERAYVEADRALRTPPTREAVRAWLKGIAAAASNPPTENDFNSKFAMVCDVSGNLPACLWTPETRREYIQSSPGWWPSAGEIDSFLRGKLNGLINIRARLRTLGQAPTMLREGVATEVRPSEEEREAVLAKFRPEFEAAMAPIREANTDPKTRIESRPLRPDHLAKLRAEDPMVQRALSIQAEQRRAKLEDDHAV